MSTAGCGGEGSSALSWDPEAIAAKAFEQLDSDRNDALNLNELASAPGVLSALEAIDADKNQQISRAELQQRITQYKESGVGLVPTSLMIVQKKEPVPHVKVRLIPEKFLEGIVQPAQGMSNGFGFAKPRISGAEGEGIHLGFYRVEVDHAKAPRNGGKGAKDLGVEVAPTSEDDDSGSIQISLGS